MRDRKRIDRILKLVKKIWKKDPDLRLLQLLYNCLWGVSHCSDLYDVEDMVVEEELKRLYNG